MADRQEGPRHCGGCHGTTHYRCFCGVCPPCPGLHGGERLEAAIEAARARGWDVALGSGGSATTWMIEVFRSGTDDCGEKSHARRWETKDFGSLADAAAWLAALAMEKETGRG